MRPAPTHTRGRSYCVPEELDVRYVSIPAIRPDSPVKHSDTPVIVPGNVSCGSTPDYCTAQTKVSYRVLRL